MEERKVPALRFEGFEDGWKDISLGSITKWKSGGTPSKEKAEYWNGDIPWISASSMRGSEYFDSENKISDAGLKGGSTIAKKNTLLLLVRGSMLFNTVPVGIAMKDVAFNQDVKNIEIADPSFSKFILYWFQHSEPMLLNSVTGTGIGAGKLDTDELKKTRLSLPSLPEQQKIASFFTAIDQKLAQLRQKKSLLERYKKGIMQQLFSQALRFRDEEGDEYPEWETKTLGDVLTEHKIKNAKSVTTEVFSVAKEKGVINQIEHLGRSYAAKDIAHYKVAFPHDVIYTKSPTSDFPYGIVKQNKLGRAGVVSPLYGVFKPINKNIGYLLDYYFSVWQNTFNYLNPLVQKGAKNTMNINNEDFLFGGSITLPVDENEQEKIVSLLQSFNNKISQTATQIKTTERWKSGLLQKMFC